MLYGFGCSAIKRKTFRRHVSTKNENVEMNGGNMAKIEIKIKRGDQISDSQDIFLSSNNMLAPSEDKIRDNCLGLHGHR